jgi:hypothetical protein
MSLQHQRRGGSALFFDQYPRFLQSSDTASGRWRLNLRYEAMLADDTDVLSGARVIDLVAHDGRWSFAVLKVGAAHVTGIEAREHPVDNARRSLSAGDCPHVPHAWQRPAHVAARQRNDGEGDCLPHIADKR